jgi:hypothetical protein
VKERSRGHGRVDSQGNQTRADGNLADGDAFRHPERWVYLPSAVVAKGVVALDRDGLSCPHGRGALVSHATPSGAWHEGKPVDSARVSLVHRGRHYLRVVGWLWLAFLFLTSAAFAQTIVYDNLNRPIRLLDDKTGQVLIENGCEGMGNVLACSRSIRIRWVV